jgi:hypothetical protein
MAMTPKLLGAKAQSQKRRPLSDMFRLPLLVIRWSRFESLLLNANCRWTLWNILLKTVWACSARLFKKSGSLLSMCAKTFGKGKERNLWQNSHFLGQKTLHHWCWREPVQQQVSTQTCQSPVWTKVQANLSLKTPSEVIVLGIETSDRKSVPSFRYIWQTGICSTRTCFPVSLLYNLMEVRFLKG